MADLGCFREVKIGDTVLFITEQSHVQEIRNALTSIKLNYDDIFQRYLAGEDNLRQYIFKRNERIIGYEANFPIEYYKKYMDKSVSIKHVYIYGAITKSLLSYTDIMKLIETVEEEDMKNYYYLMHHIQHREFTAAEKFLDKCFQYDQINFYRAIIYARLKREAEAFEILKELISNNFAVEECKTKLLNITEDYCASLSLSAEIFYYLKMFEKALNCYIIAGLEDDNKDKIIDCCICAYKENKTKEKASRLAEFYKKEGNLEEAVKWFKLSI